MDHNTDEQDSKLRGGMLTEKVREEILMYSAGGGASITQQVISQAVKKNT